MIALQGSTDTLESINKFVDTMQMILGLNSEEMAIRIGDRKNLAMALGAIELSPLELAKIYGTIASGGLSIDPVTVLKVTDFDGTELYKADLEKPRQRILDPIACAMVLNLMQAVISAEGTMPLKYKEIDGISGGKTGTVQSPAAAKAKYSATRNRPSIMFFSISLTMNTSRVR